MDFLRTVATVVGVLISAPLLVALVRAAMFFGRMTNTIEGLQDSLKSFVVSVDKRFDEQDVRIDDHNSKLAVLWDGHERRGGVDRRKPGEPI